MSVLFLLTNPEVHVIIIIPETASEVMLCIGSLNDWHSFPLTKQKIKKLYLYAPHSDAVTHGILTAWHFSHYKSCCTTN